MAPPATFGTWIWQSKAGQQAAWELSALHGHRVCLFSSSVCPGARVAGMAKIVAREYSGVTGNVGTLAWVSSCFVLWWSSQQWRSRGLVAGSPGGQASHKRLLQPCPGKTQWEPWGASFASCCAARNSTRLAPLQAAPEMLLGARCTEKADIYSYGEFLSPAHLVRLVRAAGRQAGKCLAGVAPGIVCGPVRQSVDLVPGQQLHAGLSHGACTLQLTP